MRSLSGRTRPGGNAEQVDSTVVESIYERLAGVYDVAFGPVLQPGRRQAVRSMDLRPGMNVLEVGVGTGLSVSLYPDCCDVVGIDLSAAMLGKAHERLDRLAARHVTLHQMDAADLQFADESFDVVYAPHVISVVPDPARVVRQMRRVCRRGGRLVILNHFLSRSPLLSRVERRLSPFTLRLGFKTDLELPAILEQAALEPASIRKVNIPPLWALVVCIKP